LNGSKSDPKPERNLRRESAVAWSRLLALVAEVYGSDRTWLHIRNQSTDDPALYRCAEPLGFKAIAERDRFTSASLEVQFRSRYERASTAGQDFGLISADPNHGEPSISGTESPLAAGG